MAETNVVSHKLPTFWTFQPVPACRGSVYNTWRNIRPNQVCLYHRCFQPGHGSPPPRPTPYSSNKNKYETVKTRLTNSFGLTRRVRASKLRQMDALGDRMPSVLLDEMLALFEGHQPCTLFEPLLLTGCQTSFVFSWLTLISLTHAKSLSRLTSCGSL